jgi:hypothetical protein
MRQERNQDGGMEMKQKDKSVWVLLDSSQNPYYAYSKKLYKTKEYIPASEVARLLNEINSCLPGVGGSLNDCRKIIAGDLCRSGFKVRWDSKKGKFV